MDPYIKAPGSNDQKRLYSSAENTAEIKPSSTSQPDSINNCFDKIFQLLQENIVLTWRLTLAPRLSRSSTIWVSPWWLAICKAVLSDRTISTYKKKPKNNQWTASWQDLSSITFSPNHGTREITDLFIPKRGEKSLRHVAMEAKFLDNNKPKKSLGSLFTIFQTSSTLSSII